MQLVVYLIVSGILFRIVYHVFRMCDCRYAITDMTVNASCSHLGEKFSPSRNGSEGNACNTLVCCARVTRIANAGVWKKKHTTQRVQKKMIYKLQHNILILSLITYQCRCAVSFYLLFLNNNSLLKNGCAVKCPNSGVV